MQHFFRLKRAYLRDEGGAYAVFIALMSGTIALAAHVGLNAFQIQNPQTAAEQLVDIACQRVAQLDPALYENENLAAAAVERLLNERRVAELDRAEGRFTVTPQKITSHFVTPADSAGRFADLRRFEFTVRYQGQVTGLHSGLTAEGRAPINVSKTCRPVCQGQRNVVYNAPTAAGHWINWRTVRASTALEDDQGKPVFNRFSPVNFAGQKLKNPDPNNSQLLVTVMTEDERIRYRRLITLPTNIYFDAPHIENRDPEGPRVQRIVIDEDDQIVIQHLNADGSLPPVCGPAVCEDASCDGSMTGPEPVDPPVTPVNRCAAAFDKLTLPAPVKRSQFALPQYDPAKHKVVFNYPQNGKPGSLVFTGQRGNGSTFTIRVRLAPFYLPNPTRINVVTKTGSIVSLRMEEFTAFSHMLNQRHVVIVPNAYYPTHRFLYHLHGANLTYWWDGQDVCERFFSPIVFDTLGLGQIYTTRHDPHADLRHTSPLFDLDGDGHLMHVEWPIGLGQAWLVDNRDGQAASDMNGRRLFGTHDDFDDGYQKLATLDSSGTGVLRGADLEGLMLWFDNGNARVDSGELKSVQEVGITAIETRSSSLILPNGRAVLRSKAIMQGREIMTEDIFVHSTPPDPLAAQQGTQ